MGDIDQNHDPAELEHRPAHLAPENRDVTIDGSSRTDSASINKGLNPLVQTALSSSSEDSRDSTDTEFVECCIGGYRFGIPTSYVVDSDVWCTAYLEPISGGQSATGIAGQAEFDGQLLRVIDLRQLFFLDEELDSTPQMYLLVEVEQDRFILLIDGLMSIQRVPTSRFKSFTSLYVSGVRWLSGAFIFEHAVVTMLDLTALTRLSQDQ